MYKLLPFKALLLSLVVLSWAGSVSCESRKPTYEAPTQENASGVEPGSTDCAPAGDPTVLAKIGEEAITEGKLDDKAKDQLYQVRKQAVESYVFTNLLEREAKKKKKTKEEVLAKAISKKEVKEFYDKAASRRKNVPPLEQVEGQIREILARGDYFKKLKEKYKVAYLVEPPRIKVAVGDLPARGAAKAPIQIVEFSDYQCPHCKRGADTIKEVLREYRGKVKVYFRDFPLAFHKEAKPASVAARCAADQGKFWEYHDLLFENQRSINKETFLAHAKELKLNTGKFEKCIGSGKYEKKVDADMASGGEVGVTGTPAFFVNGVRLGGAVPIEKFRDILDEELARIKGSKGSKAASLP